MPEPDGIADMCVFGGPESAVSVRRTLRYLEGCVCPGETLFGSSKALAAAESEAADGEEGMDLEGVDPGNKLPPKPPKLSEGNWGAAEAANIGLDGNDL